jgi:hypothetical protein
LSARVYFGGAWHPGARHTARMVDVSFYLRPDRGRAKPDPSETLFLEGSPLADKLYKYLAPDLAGKALSHDGATLKFSLPSEFNDPFELFLTVDHNSPPATLAFYDEVIGDDAHNMLLTSP